MKIGFKKIQYRATLRLHALAMLKGRRFSLDILSPTCASPAPPTSLPPGLSGDSHANRTWHVVNGSRATWCKGFWHIFVLTAALNLTSSANLKAQTLTTLYNFSVLPTGIGYQFPPNYDGANPTAGLILSGGFLYGTTPNGGKYGQGTVISLSTGTFYQVSTLYNISVGNTGSGPFANGLAISGNTLYGTAGGGSALGEVFAVATNGSTSKTLYDWVSGGSSGQFAAGTLAISGAVLYGVAEDAIFAINTNGADFTNLYQGLIAATGVSLYGNTLYGTMGGNGDFGYGGIFAANTNGSDFTNLYSFTRPLSAGPLFTNTDGYSPNGGLLMITTPGTGTNVSRILYGTTASGGMYGGGTVFALNVDTGSFSTLHDFSSPNGTSSDGAKPNGGLALLGQTLFGTTSLGGASGNGTVFEVNVDGTGFIPVHSFGALGLGYGEVSGNTINIYTNTDGAVPEAGLIASGTNTLYGTTSRGGQFGSGSIFTLSISYSAPSIQHEPSNSIVVSGTNIQFAVSASGEIPLYYQWYFNGLQIAGGTNSTLGINDVTTNQTGYYTVVITNAVGSITSTPAYLAVYDYPAITSQTPASSPFYTVNGTSVILSVTATGTALQYQWFNNSGAVSGATNSSLVLSNVTSVMNGSSYWVAVSNPVGSVTSSKVQLTLELAVRHLPTLSLQNIVGYWPNVPMTNTIEVAPPAGTTSYVVQDQFSVLNNSNFFYTVQNISSSGHFDAVHGIVKWVFLDGNPRTLTYQIVPGDNATNWMDFSGLVSINGVNTTISGDSQINLLPLDPADNDPPIANQINAFDAYDYYYSWLTGTNWPVEPSLFVPGGIPADYVSRTIYIWLGEEYYIYDPSAGGPPLCWVRVNGPPSSGTTQSSIAMKASMVKADEPDGAKPLGNSQSTAVCSMTDVYTDNVPFTVTITVTPDSSVIAYLAEDQVPAGWAVTNILVDGATLSGYTAFDSYHSEVKWGPFPDNTARVLSYQITPPANATGTFTFSGIAIVDVGTSIPITGVRQVNSAVAIPAPVITGISLSGANLIINGTNGISGNPYITLMSAKLSLPLNQWTPVATNTLYESGNFIITATNAVDAKAPQRFYTLQMQ